MSDFCEDSILLSFIFKVTLLLLSFCFSSVTHVHAQGPRAMPGTNQEKCDPLNSKKQMKWQFITLLNFTHAHQKQLTDSIVVSRKCLTTTSYRSSSRKAISLNTAITGETGVRSPG